MSQGVIHRLRRSSGLWFQLLFVISAIIGAITSFIALNQTSFIEPVPSGLKVLLFGNTAILFVLGWMIAQRYFEIRASRNDDGGGRLAQRFMVLFALAAMVPSIVVSLFLWASTTNGIETWFGDRVSTIVADATSVAEEEINAFSEAFEGDTIAMATDVSNAAEPFETERDLFEDFLRVQALFRNISAAFIVDATGAPVAQAQDMSDLRLFRRPSDETLIQLESGDPIVFVDQDAGFAYAMIKLEEFSTNYLYVAKPISLEALARYARAADAFQDLQVAGERKSELTTLFFIAYMQIVALVLLLSVRLAQALAAQITAPISRLVAGASDVSHGHRGVTVPLPGTNDEIHALSSSFNSMTRQLDERRRDLVQAREIAEERQTFLETLLSDLSAGVIRIDERGNITLANRSAETLLGRESLVGSELEDVAPEMAQLVRQSRDRTSELDSSLELKDDKGGRHIRLKVTPDSTDGLVLTFDDATRLVSVQRQLAWKDVARRVAHEIRNPLTPIQLSTERLKRRYAKQIDDADGVFSKCIDTISRQVGDIDRMVQEFSDFARMPQPTPVTFEFVSLIRDICFAQQVVSPDLKINVSTNVATIRAMGDERLLAQAFGNLIKNAAQALGAREERFASDIIGQIDVQISRESDEVIKICVADNGPGFPSDVKDKLLEPYVTARVGGTGLGLAIAHRVITDHSGIIRLKDRDDGESGAIVEVKLPVALIQDVGSSYLEVEFTQ